MYVCMGIHKELWLKMWLEFEVLYAILIGDRKEQMGT